LVVEKRESLTQVKEEDNILNVDPSSTHRDSPVNRRPKSGKYVAPMPKKRTISITKLVEEKKE